MILPPIPKPESDAPPVFSGPSVLDEMYTLEHPAERKARDIQRIIAELAGREREAHKLYEPLPVQERFHKSRTKTRLVRGSNRGGKTLPCAVEAARAFMGVDPYGKYPKKGIAYIVGYDYSHHGQTIYPKLFLPGAFRIIKDEHTRLWRAFRPWMPEDQARVSEAIEADPLIPERMVSEVSWYDKKENTPSFIRLVTGWEIWFFSGDGKPPRGQAIDFGWLDEEIGGHDWHAELLSRCVDRNGLIQWSASPQSGTVQLYELHEQAAAQEGSDRKVTEEFVVKLADNPHLNQSQKDDLEAAQTSESERITRIEGEFIQSAQKIYSEYSLKIHGTPYIPIPAHWTRYAVTDPGHQICAVLFAAVPPPDEQADLGSKLFLYDELYIPRCSAALYAEKMQGKTAGLVFQDFIIDRRGSRVTEAGSGLTIVEQYSKALKEKGVACKARGSNFLWGSDDVTGGIESVRSFLKIQHTGKPGLRILTQTLVNGQLVNILPNFEWEIQRYANKKVKNVVIDKPEETGRVHLMACLRYLCAFGPKYVPVPPPEPVESEVYKEFMKKQNAGRRSVGLRFGVGREN